MKSGYKVAQLIETNCLLCYGNRWSYGYPNNLCSLSLRTLEVDHSNYDDIHVDIEAIGLTIESIYEIHFV